MGDGLTIMPISVPVFEELRSLFSKTAGIVPILKSELERFGDRIRWAAIYGLSRAWGGRGKKRH